MNENARKGKVLLRNMEPEEKFIKEVWYVLRQIKERSLYTPTGTPIEYWIDFNTMVAGVPLAKDEAAILEKLEEWGAIRIQNKGGYWEYE
ncbi:MAG: hypothetical protein A3D67_01510 [Candidatus Lloydbacteria bacterium RIFCSPHIGHO2_02_FULL_51_22]|uniref:Uncharacterized protein n=2 Tax=Candidatus Lloydiibacteriota TaxID=1817910 RepID=A0A1G2D626_9BACT|nr:MAG: hypothetical protein A3D67_01510 [Candidatus Lloydbacteria bacterium RIFCSPHIGHO2_02_FULL_51_22]